MAPSESKRLIGRKVTAVACFDSFGKLAMIMLAACRREGAETTLLLLELNNRALSRRQRLEIRRIDPKTRIEKHNWHDLRPLCGALLGGNVRVGCPKGYEPDAAVLEQAQQLAGDRCAIITAH